MTSWLLFENHRYDHEDGSFKTAPSSFASEKDKDSFSEPVLKDVFVEAERKKCSTDIKKLQKKIRKDPFKADNETRKRKKKQVDEVELLEFEDVEDKLTRIEGWIENTLTHMRNGTIDIAMEPIQVSIHRSEREYFFSWAMGCRNQTFCKDGLEFCTRS